jgi:hypothetical protein
MTQHTKPIATALNEVTVTIMSKTSKVNYHETFMLNTTEDNTFEFKGDTYNIPAEDTHHYIPSFWQIGLRLGMFYEQHQLWATLFDWFKLRKHAKYEIGYLYYEGSENPVKIPPPDFDWGKENYMLEQNTTIEGTFKDADDKLRPEKTGNSNLLMLVAIIAIAIIAVIVILSLFLSGAFNPKEVAEVVQTVTSSPTPSPSYFATPAPSVVVIPP